MLRRVVQHGPSTLTVSLPTQWTKKNGVGKGSEVEVCEGAAGLTITLPFQKQKPQRIDVDFSQLTEDAINSLLAVLHKCTYREIHITFSDKLQFDIIARRIKDMLTGYEIIERSEHSCLIQTIVADIPEEIGKLIRRTFHVSLEMAQGTVHVLHDHDHTKIQDLLELEKTNNRLTNQSHRLINSTMPGDKGVFQYLVSWILESICDSYRDILYSVSTHPDEKIPIEHIELLSDTTRLFSRYADLFFSYSNAELVEIRNEHKRIHQQLLCLSSNTDFQRMLSYSIYIILQCIYSALGSTIALNY